MEVHHTDVKNKISNRSANRPSFFKVAAVSVFGFLLLLAPAILNRGPIYWFDTIAYLHGGSTAIEAVVGYETRYGGLQKVSVPGEAATPAEGNRPESDQVSDDGGDPNYRISTARSPYYAVVLAFVSDIGGSFAPVVLNAALMLLAGIALLRVVFETQYLGPALWLLVATSLSTAGVFVAFLMPDILAPLAILSVGVLFSFYDKLRLGGKFLWTFLLLASTISHSTHFAVTFLLLPFGCALAWASGRSAILRPAMCCVGVLGATVAANFLFVQAVSSLYGYKPLPLPMIAASLITDPPGRSFLEETCPDNQYVYCSYLDTRATETDEFLWSSDPELGVYQFLDSDTRIKMSEQQFQFLVDTLRHDPIGQLSISFSRFVRQIFDTELDQMTYREPRKEVLRSLPVPDRSVAIKSALFEGTISFESFGKFTHYIYLLSGASLILFLTLAWVGSSAFGRISKDPSFKSLSVFSALIIAGVVFNSGLTGAASQPQGRYAARVALLLPVLLSLWGAWVVRRGGRPQAR